MAMVITEDGKSVRAAIGRRRKEFRPRDIVQAVGGRVSEACVYRYIKSMGCEKVRPGWYRRVK